jgi:5'-3' exonuclease
LPQYPSSEYLEEVDNWEKLLLKEVVQCIKEVWIVAGKPLNVYIAVDGVVPMAKIRQQRVRRFKSAWLRNNTEGPLQWDSNAITPGTLFMDKLSDTLRKEAAKHGSSWVVSGVDQSGEGEHKILMYLRSNPPSPGSSIVVYGLDADLILLTMLISEELKLDMLLLREKQEFGIHAQPPQDAQEYSFLSIHELKTLINITDYESAINYIGLMTLMGNDFIPHSLTHKLNSDGHDFVIREMLKMIDTKHWLVDSNGRLNFSLLRGIFSRWGKDEAARMEFMISKKQDQSHRGVLKGMNESEGLPLKWNIEAAFLSKGRLRSNWKDLYWGCMNENVDRASVCEEYIRGLQWVLDYYTGKPINKEWMYPYWIPPLWSDLEQVHTLPFSKTQSGNEPMPEEQLAMVLPLSSWGLIRNSKLKTLPYICPQFWPLEFTFFSLGRTWLWECEARIPVLTAGRLRDVLTRDI